MTVPLPRKPYREVPQLLPNLCHCPELRKQSENCDSNALNKNYRRSIRNRSKFRPGANSPAHSSSITRSNSLCIRGGRRLTILANLLFGLLNAVICNGCRVMAYRSSKDAINSAPLAYIPSLLGGTDPSLIRMSQRIS